MGLGHERADCRTPGLSRASADSLITGVRFQKTPGLLANYLWVKPVLVISAKVLTGRAGSWSLAAGFMDPRAAVR